MLVGALLMTGGSYAVITWGLFPIAFKAALLGIVLGPIAIIINVVSLFRGGPQVVFNEQGIHDRRTSWGVIAWHEIVAVQVIAVLGTRFVRLHLADEPACLARLSGSARLRMRFHSPNLVPVFLIPFQGLTPGVNEAQHFLATNHADKLAIEPGNSSLTSLSS